MTQARAGYHPATLSEQELQPSPIEPGWIISGEPRARLMELVRSPDGTCMSAEWDCTAGTFHWFFGVEETVHILEGEVSVRDHAGREFLLRAGDVAVMPANAWMVWRVDHYVRKLAHCRYPVPQPFGRILRKIQSWRNRVNLKRSKRCEIGTASMAAMMLGPELHALAPFIKIVGMGA